MIAKRRLSIPNQTATEDMLIGMVTALTSEIAVLRERLDTTERLLERAGVFRLADLERFVADEAATLERERLRRGLISRVFRPVEEAARGNAL